MKKWGAKNPVVLVIGSERVEQICQKNNLSLTQLLRPLAETLPRIRGIHFRSVSKSVALKNFGIRCVGQHELDPIDYKFAETFLDGVVRASPPSHERSPDGIRDELDVDGFHRVFPNPTPWMDEYRRELENVLQFNPIEFIDQPVACIYAISTEEADPIQLIDQMRSMRNLPELFRAGHYDSAIYRSYVLVHDNHCAEPNVLVGAQKTLKTMDQIFGSSQIAIVPINSIPLTQPDSTRDDKWSPGITPINDPKYMKDIKPKRGMYLAQSDEDTISSFIADFLLKGLLPHMEKKLLGLSENVAAARKGFRNQVKLFFGKRDTKGVKKAPNTTAQYELTSTEAQIRQLSDFAFVMQDYELALSNYKLISGDYKTDKSWAHYAGAQEMIGICTSFTDGAPRDISHAFESAFTTYHSIGDVRRATLSAMNAADAFMLIKGRALEASQTLVKAHEKDNSVRGALLMERAAYSLLHVQPQPLVRKYASHLVVAGHSFVKHVQNIHGVRCYVSASSVYEGKGWSRVEDHIHLHLGRDCFNLGDFEAAIRHFVALIGKGIAKTQGADRQQDVLNELLFVVKKWTSGKTGFQEVPNLKLPRFLPDSVTVNLQDAQTVSASFTDGCWAAVNRKKPALSLDKDHCNTPVLTKDEKMFSDADRACVVGETITLQVTVLNPLELQLKVKNMRLRCDFETEGPNGEASSEGEVEVQSQDFDLMAEETKIMELKVTCSKPGQLRIRGIEWRVNEILCGYHVLILPERLVLEIRRQRLHALMKPNNDLNVPIKNHMPLLRYEFTKFPTRLMHGEFVRCTCTLTNKGKKPLTKLEIHVSHAAFIAIQKLPQHLDLQDKISERQAYISDQIYPYDWENGAMTIPVELAPEESITLTMGLRGAFVGIQRIAILFRYEENKSEKPRLALFTRELEVSPLMRISMVHQKNSFVRVQETILGMEIASKQVVPPSDPNPVHVNFKQISFISRAWDFDALKGTTNKRTLGNNETHMLFCRVSSMDDVEPSDDPKKTCEDFEEPQVANIVFGKAFEEREDPDMAEEVCADPLAHSLIRIEKAIMMEDERLALLVNPGATTANINSTDKFDIVLSWETPDGQRTGYHHVPGVACMKTAQQSCALKVVMNFQSQVDHNFATNGYLQVPVSVCIRNSTNDGKPMTFVFEALTIQEDFDNVAKAFKKSVSSNITGRYHWVGDTIKKVENLEAHATVTLWLSAMFVTPGHYNLNRFRLTVQDVDLTGGGKTKPRVFFFPVQHLISVGDASSVGEVGVADQHSLDVQAIAEDPFA